MCEDIQVHIRPDVGLMLITANVGTLFEDPTRLLKVWLQEFLNNVSVLRPDFLALHLQEVGGKTYEKSMDHVQEFIRTLCDDESMKDYTYVRIFMDEDFKSAEHFTALGNIYFGHKNLQSLKIWSFLTHEWETAEDRSIYSGNIESIPTKEKSKFPQHFFPECKWSRKGFMRTRWEMNGTVLDLVNIHLFHDASNLAACEEFPSVYCKTRRRALVHTLERFHLDEKNGLVPFFVFGDFNFRCDTEGVIKELTENLTIHRSQSVKSDCTKVHYRNSTGNNVLTVGKKEFSHADHQLKFKENWLKKFDRELEPLNEVLIEYPITFAPSYPFEEDPEMPTDYMSTRCPSWCDRILMSPQVKDIIGDNSENLAEAASHYGMIGESVCMGDHKPIYLSVRLKANRGTYKCCDCKDTLINNKMSTSQNNPAVTVCCPFRSNNFKKILIESTEPIRRTESLKNLQLPKVAFCNISEKDRINIDCNINNSETVDPTRVGQNPQVSINIIDTDNIYVCTCAQLSSSHTPTLLNADGALGDGSICHKCRNIIKKQPTEHRYRLVSKQLMLSENVIVNRIDTQHLSTYFDNSKEDPYTPESNESHSPYTELNSTSTNTSTTSRSPYGRISPPLSQNVSIKKKEDNFGKRKVDKSSAQPSILKIPSEENLESTEHCDNHPRGVVSPGQLKSRLEDLQRLSMQTCNSDRQDILPAGESEESCSPKSLSNTQRHNLGYLSRCCNIH